MVNASKGNNQSSYIYFFVLDLKPKTIIHNIKMMHDLVSTPYIQP